MPDSTQETELLGIEPRAAHSVGILDTSSFEMQKLLGKIFLNIYEFYFG